MGRSTRNEAVVKLREQIAAADDPELIIRLTRQLSKLLPRAKAKMGRPRNTPAAPDVEQAGTFKESDYPGQAHFLKELPMGEREFWRLIFGVENELRRLGFAGLPQMTEAEENVFKEKIVAGWADAERTAFNTYEHRIGEESVVEN